MQEALRKWIEAALKEPGFIRESKWTQSIAVGDKSFFEQIKERLGIRANGRRIHEGDDEYQLREGPAVYGGGRDAATENTFDSNFAH